MPDTPDAVDLAAAIDRLVILRDLALELTALRWSGDLDALEAFVGRPVTIQSVLGETTAALLEGRRGPLRAIA